MQCRRSSYCNYWSRSLRFPTIADAIPRIRYKLLRCYIRFVDHYTEHDANDKRSAKFCKHLIKRKT